MAKTKIQLLKRFGFILTAVTVVATLPKCAFKKFIKTDKDISEHYKNSAVKPVYKKTPVGNREIHYAVMAKNDSLPLLVFVHGAPGAWYGYMNLMDDSLLQNKYKMISVDRLGYGKSGYGKPELSVEQQAKSIQAIIDKENVSGKKVVLCGRSYGAPITALVAIDNPQEVDRLMMISPVIDPSKEKFYWFSKAGKWKVVQKMLPKMMNVATAEKFSHVEEMKKLLPEWSSLSVPTTVLTGEKDWVADVANFDFAKKHLVNCDTTMIKISDAGHRLTAEKPELIKRLLIAESNQNATYSAMAN